MTYLCIGIGSLYDLQMYRYCLSIYDLPVYRLGCLYDLQRYRYS